MNNALSFSNQTIFLQFTMPESALVRFKNNEFKKVNDMLL